MNRPHPACELQAAIHELARASDLPPPEVVQVLRHYCDVLDLSVAEEYGIAALNS